MKRILCSILALCGAASLFAQGKTYDLFVVAEGNFGTPNGDVYKASRFSSTTLTVDGPLYANANNSTGIDVLQDFGIFGDKAIFCGKGSNPVKLAITQYPSFDTLITFTNMGGVQCLGKASNTKAYISLASGGNLRMVDLVNNSISPVNDPGSLLSSYASYMVQANGYEYVAIGSKIVKVDTLTNTTTTTILPNIGAIAGMQYDEARNCIWLLGKVSGTSALVRLEPANNDALGSAVILTGITNAAQLRYAVDKLYFLSGKNVHAYHITSPNIPTPSLYTSNLSGNSFSFAYGKSFDVDPATGDFALATAGNYAQPSQYEVVDGTTFQLIDTGSVAGRIANELILHTYSNPVPDTLPLPDVYAQCAVTLIPPTALSGNTLVTGTTSDPLSYAAQGTYTVTWTFTNGNSSSTHTQQVIVQDTIAPVPDNGNLADLQGNCPFILEPPTATDNCAGSLTATTDSLAFTTAGSYTIQWTYDDGHGNTSVQSQQLTVNCSPTSLTQPDAATAFHFYPNPADREVTVVAERRNNSPMEVILWNTLGQPVLRTMLAGHHTTLSLEGYAPGIYFLQLVQAGRHQGSRQKLQIR